ncbi:PREDICTED: homeobox-leucine zipper protein HAT5-like isoform X2 [Nicotiana attenuata]|uniref:homeobox-leucine zipper protein HAT5-like isoform X2 n=1 Tax=Nicotiana attenuata TaxID=49451 RepID=UPI000904AC4E|nr:PREDICTED: homeobox-leucine zipper protein HAT5-like isoform X2 [Nicotiana attenuata]
MIFGLIPTPTPLCYMLNNAIFVFASGSMVSFGGVNGGNISDRSFFQSVEENETDELEEYLHQPEKKRRLTADQVQFLEKSFEVENKLEPERKDQLAKELGLQPRQIAIWFQNRRARWRTKQLENDYEALRNKYDNLKADYINLVKEKDDLRAQVIQFTDMLLHKEKEKGELATSDIKELSDASPKENMIDPVLEDEMSTLSAIALKQHKDLNSVKSDVFDSENLVQSSILDQGDSSYAFEPDQSDLSQDEEENLSKNLVAKVVHDHYPMTSSNLSCFGYPVEDQGFGFWSF